MTNNFQRINIAVKIPKDISKEAIRLSNLISENNEAYFTLDGTSFIPHITLYSSEYPIKTLMRC